MIKTILVAALVFLLTNCSGQAPVRENNKPFYDTVKLLLPKPGPEDVATPADYKHSIDLTKDFYVVTVSGRTYKKTSEHELSSFIKANRERITKQRISIICDSTTPAEKIVTTLDLLTELQIKSYKIVFVNGKFLSEEPIIVQQPFEKRNIVDDSTTLTILISKQGFETSLLNSKQKHQSISELETFMVSNKKNIDGDKIVVIGDGNLSYATVNPVFLLLKKYEYWHFKILTK